MNLDLIPTDPNELDDELLADVVGAFSEGETVYLKTGETRCVECGTRYICGTYLGKEGARLAHVRFACGHETYIPQRAMETR